jgi:ubiquinone/menaquinone biosynthesis C-methylase UbiE
MGMAWWPGTGFVIVERRNASVADRGGTLPVTLTTAQREATMNDTTNLFADGEAYEVLMGRWSRLVGDQFIDWLDVPKGLRWLDVGCGNGAFTERLINRCAPAEVIGIDPSQEQLAYAVARSGTKVAKFQRGNAQDLSFGDGSFDVAVMALVLSFLGDPAKAIAEMARVVRPGGWVATYMWDVPGGGLPHAPFHAAMKSLGISLPIPPGSANSQRDAMLALWQKAGLKSIEMTVIRIHTSYANFDEFWNASTVSVGPLSKAIHEMSAGMREQLRSRLRQQLSTSADGAVSYEAFVNAAKGRRSD